MADLSHNPRKGDIDAGERCRNDHQVPVVLWMQRAEIQPIIQQATSRLSTIGIVFLFSAYAMKCFEIQGLSNPVDFTVLAFLLLSASVWSSFHVTLKYNYSQVVLDLSYTTMGFTMWGSLTYYSSRIYNDIENYSFPACSGVLAAIAAGVAYMVGIIHYYDLAYLYSSVPCDQEQMPWEISTSIERAFYPSVIMLSLSGSFQTYSPPDALVAALQAGEDAYSLGTLESALWQMKLLVIAFATYMIMIEFSRIIKGSYGTWLWALVVDTLWGITLAGYSIKCTALLAQLNPGLQPSDYSETWSEMCSASSNVLYIGVFSILLSVLRYVFYAVIDIPSTLRSLHLPGGWRTVPRQVLTNDMIVSLLRITCTEKERDDIVSVLYHLPSETAEEQMAANYSQYNKKDEGNMEVGKIRYMQEVNSSLRSGRIDVEMGLRVSPAQ